MHLVFLIAHDKVVVVRGAQRVVNLEVLPAVLVEVM